MCAGEGRRRGHGRRSQEGPRDAVELAHAQVREQTQDASAAQDAEGRARRVVYVSRSHGAPHRLASSTGSPIGSLRLTARHDRAGVASPREPGARSSQSPMCAVTTSAPRPRRRARRPSFDARRRDLHQLAAAERSPARRDPSPSSIGASTARVGRATRGRRRSKASETWWWAHATRPRAASPCSGRGRDVVLEGERWRRRQASGEERRQGSCESRRRLPAARRHQRSQPWGPTTAGAGAPCRHPARSRPAPSRGWLHGVREVAHHRRGCAASASRQLAGRAESACAGAPIRSGRENSSPSSADGARRDRVLDEPGRSERVDPEERLGQAMKGRAHERRPGRVHALAISVEAVDLSIRSSGAPASAARRASRPPTSSRVAELSRRQTRTRRAIRAAGGDASPMKCAIGPAVSPPPAARQRASNREEARVELHQFSGELDPLLADHPLDRGPQARLAQVREVHLAGRVDEDVARVQVGMGEARILRREAERRQATRERDPPPSVLEVAERRSAEDPAQTQRPAAAQALDAREVRRRAGRRPAGSVSSLLAPRARIDRAASPARERGTPSGGTSRSPARRPRERSA